MGKFGERMIPEEEISKTAQKSGDLNLENPLPENSKDAKKNYQTEEIFNKSSDTKNPNDINNFLLELHKSKTLTEYIDLFERNKNDITKSLKIIETLNTWRLLEAGRRLEETNEEENIINVINVIDENSNNFFVKTKIKQIMTPPLDDYSLIEKRLLLKANWTNLIRSKHFDDLFSGKDRAEFSAINPLDPNALSDQDVEKNFIAWRKDESPFFYWHEQQDRKGKYEQDYLREQYEIIPLSAGNHYADKNKNIRESCYSKISSNYGVVYSPSGQIDSFFPLNSDIEQNNEHAIKTYGAISESDLQFFLKKLKNAAIENNPESLLSYIQIRKMLPEQLINSFEQDLGLEVPKEIDIEFKTLAQFEQKLEPFKNRLLNELKVDQKYQKFSRLTAEMGNLLIQRKMRAKEKYFGYASEQTESLDFFASFINKLPPHFQGGHFSISYYLYLRQNLPEDLVEEFEKKFSLNISPNLKQFDTFDDFLATSDLHLLIPFIENNNPDNFKEMAQWLCNKIIELSEKIKTTKHKPEQLTIQDVLDREGFPKNLIDENTYKRLTLTYATLIDLPMREVIEKEFNIQLNRFSAREQIQFVNFLSLKTNAEVEKIKQFIKTRNGGKDSDNRIKSFLSLEFGQDLGEKILDIDDNLKKQPEIADTLFAEYAKIVDSAEKTAEEISQTYNKIFYAKQLDKERIIQGLLRGAKDLLVDSSQRLNGMEEEKDKEILTRKGIEEFKKQQAAHKKILNELKEIAMELNRRYGEIYKKYDDITHEQFKNEIREKEFSSKDVPPEEIDEYMDYIDAMREMEYHPAVAESVDEAEKAIQEKEKIDNNFDSKRIEEIMKKMEYYLSGWANRNGEVSDFRDELENLLKFQKTFEKKLEQIVYGEESASLPKEFTASLPREIAEIGPERLPANTPLYFPVGISKELPEWKKVFEYGKKAAKPIDLYGYMFWLENQGRPVELVVCDEIQATNYAALYPDYFDRNQNSLSDFGNLARKIGEREKENYQKIINAFGLKNIKMVDYREFVDRNKDQFEKYRGLCEGLAKNPIFAESFLSMVQESVAQSMTREEKEKFLPYAIEEVSWILATEGSKASHINEARYDVLAAVIKNTEKYAKDHMIDIFDPQNKDKLPSIINGVLIKLKDRFSATKSASKNNQETFEYYAKAEQILKKIRLTAGAAIPLDFSKKYAEYSFAVPQTGSQSFGWRSGGNKQEAVIKFREPYSTYFYENGSELFLESDQVVAAEGLIAGKILTMPAEVQQEYAERVAKPILVHYFKVLEKAPKEYFKKIKKTKEELLSECQESQTLIDLLKFIQKYIIRSSS